MSFYEPVELELDVARELVEQLTNDELDSFASWLQIRLAHPETEAALITSCRAMVLTLEERRRREERAQPSDHGLPVFELVPR